MFLVKTVVCESCSGEYEIEAEEDCPVQYCPGCGNELHEDEVEVEDDE